MNNETNELLEKLASKLGTTAEYLWGVLLNQAPIDATITLMQILVVVIIGFVLYKIHKGLDKPKADGYSKYDDSDAYGIVMVIVLLFWILLIFMSILAINDVINGYFNPEYWALEKILSQLK